MRGFTVVALLLFFVSSASSFADEPAISTADETYQQCAQVLGQERVPEVLKKTLINKWNGFIFAEAEGMKWRLGLPHSNQIEFPQGLINLTAHYMNGIGFEVTSEAETSSLILVPTEDEGVPESELRKYMTRLYSVTGSRLAWAPFLNQGYFDEVNNRVYLTSAEFRSLTPNKEQRQASYRAALAGSSDSLFKTTVVTGTAEMRANKADDEDEDSNSKKKKQLTEPNLFQLGQYDGTNVESGFLFESKKENTLASVKKFSEDLFKLEAVIAEKTKRLLDGTVPNELEWVTAIEELAAVWNEKFPAQFVRQLSALANQGMLSMEEMSKPSTYAVVRRPDSISFYSADHETKVAFWPGKKGASAHIVYTSAAVQADGGPAQVLVLKSSDSAFFSYLKDHQDGTRDMYSRILRRFIRPRLNAVRVYAEENLKLHKKIGQIMDRAIRASTRGRSNFDYKGAATEIRHQLAVFLTLTTDF